MGSGVASHGGQVRPIVGRSAGRVTLTGTLVTVVGFAPIVLNRIRAPHASPPEPARWAECR